MVSLIGASTIVLQSLPVLWHGFITANTARGSPITKGSHIKVVLRRVVILGGVVVLRSYSGGKSY